MKNMSLISFMFLSIMSNGQNNYLNLGNWIVRNVETQNGTMLYNDLGFKRMRVNTNSTIDIITGYIYNENDLVINNYRFSITDKKLQIYKDPILDFSIEKNSKNELILLMNNQRYFFNKLDINNCEYKMIDKDTVNIKMLAEFEGEFFKFYTADCSYKSSFIVESSFILRKNKQVDSIIINSPINDSVIINKAISLIKSSQKKWNPSTSICDEKIDDRITIYILFKSSELKNVTILTYYNICSKIYKRALDFQNNNQNDLSDFLYSDYISMYNFLILNQDYFRGLYCPGLTKDLNNSLFNRAALQIKQSKIDDACKNFKNIVGNKDDAEEAERYIKNYCEK